MDSEQKIEERKRWNAPFLRAFNYLLEEGCLEFVHDGNTGRADF